MKSRSEAPRVQMHLVPAVSCSLSLPHAIVKFSKCSYELSPTAVLMGAREHMRKDAVVVTRGGQADTAAALNSTSISQWARCASCASWLVRFRVIII